MFDTLYCANCEVNGRDRIKAARSYGKWGLCEECFIALGRPLLGAPRPVRKRDEVHVAALVMEVAPTPWKVRQESQASDVITNALVAHGKISVNDVRAAQVEKEARVETGWSREKMDERSRLMQADRDASMSVAAIAAKYKVNVATVYNHTKANGAKAQVSTKLATTKPAKAKPLRDGWSNENGHAKTGNMATALGLLAKWNAEADAAFAVLPLEKKAALLASLEG